MWKRIHVRYLPLWPSYSGPTLSALPKYANNRHTSIVSNCTWVSMASGILKSETCLKVIQGCIELVHQLPQLLRILAAPEPAHDGTTRLHFLCIATERFPLTTQPTFASNKGGKARITHRDNRTIRFRMHGGSVRPLNSSSVARNWPMRSTRLSMPSTVEDMVCMPTRSSFVGDSLPRNTPRSS